MAIPFIPAFVVSTVAGELITKPLADILDTSVPHENIAPRAALRMVANGTITPEQYFQLDAFQALTQQDREMMAIYAYNLRQAFDDAQVRTLQKPFLKEGVDIFKTLDDYDKAEFLGGLDDALARLKATESELVRLDRAERDAWLKEELAYNGVLVNIVEARLKATAVIA